MGGRGLLNRASAGKKKGRVASQMERKQDVKITKPLKRREMKRHRLIQVMRTS